MGVFPMEKNPHVSISVEVIYGETQHKNTLLQAVLKHKLKEDVLC